MENKLSITVKDTQSGQSTRANVVHVGDCGAFVESSETFDIGTEVSCYFQDGEESSVLQGNVTWATADPKNSTPKAIGRRKRDATAVLYKLGEEQAYDISPMTALSGGMGIRFKHLSDADAQFLVAIKSGLDRHNKTVRLQLDGVSSEVVTQGIPTYNGVELEAQIPFLKIGSSTKFSLGDKHSYYQGKVLSVTLDSARESAIPLLRVALESNAASDSIEQTYLREERVASEKRDQLEDFYGVSCGNAAEAETAPLTTYRPCVTQIETPRRNNSIPFATILVVAAVAAAWTSWLAVNRASVAENDPKDQTRIGAASSLQTPIPSPIITTKETRSRKPSMVNIEAKQADERQADERQANKRQAKSDRPAGYKYDKPRIAVNGDRSSVLIPLKGSSRGLRTYRLSTPGIAVILPKAQTLIPFNNYGVYRGFVRRVWVRPWKSGVQVRVLTAWERIHHRITFTPNGLEVVLTP